MHRGVSLLLLLLPRSSRPHFHERWDEGFAYRYRWFEQEWVGRVRQFYCDESCDKRLREAPTIDREFKTLVDLFNQTTGGPRPPVAVYRGAFEGLDEFKAEAGALTRREASSNTWKHMQGWESILHAHTST